MDFSINNFGSVVWSCTTFWLSSNAGVYQVHHCIFFLLLISLFYASCTEYVHTDFFHDMMLLESMV